MSQLSVPCARGHDLGVLALSEIRLLHGAPYAHGFVCDKCRRRFQAADSLSAHCAPCGYDLCIDCASSCADLLRCEGGHQLARVSCGDELEYSSGRYRCDACDTSPGPFPAWHCAACRFDLCLPCVLSLLGTSAPAPAARLPALVPVPSLGSGSAAVATAAGWWDASPAAGGCPYNQYYPPGYPLPPA
eukprot:m51a1_g4156 hypothetical protein (188) ;mRNA; r:256929-257954